MTAENVALLVPAARRGELHAHAVSLRDDYQGEEPFDVQDAARLAADLDGEGDTRVTAPAVLLRWVLSGGLQDAGSEIHGLCEHVAPSREAIRGQAAVVDWYLDALDTIAPFVPEETR